MKMIEMNPAARKSMRLMLVMITAEIVVMAVLFANTEAPVLAWLFLLGVWSVAIGSFRLALEISERRAHR